MINHRFRQFAWGLLVYNLAVVYWGVYVRASFSGDGCGAHWPFCGGVLVPVNPQVKTLVEGAHRLSSGLCLPLVTLLCIWAFRAYPKGHSARFWSGLCVVFTFSEALIGAGLVLFKLVSHNASVYRAVAECAHLTNTFILLACLTLTARSSANKRVPRLSGSGVEGAALTIGLIAIFALGITGTLAALGDTLNPSTSILAGIKQDFAPTASYLIRLRPLHPLIAISTAAYLAILAPMIARNRPVKDVRMFKRVLLYILSIQMVFGFINLMKHAPVWMQLEHLLIADLLWITLVLFAAAALSAEKRTGAPSTAVLQHA